MRSNQQHRFWGRREMVCGLALLAGCRSSERIETGVVNNRFGELTVAVAPAINQSGSQDFDANRFADWMALELGAVAGVRVIPVSRVLGALRSSGHDSIQSPEHAKAVAKAVGAESILVFAVTQYQPYDPPSIGITAQLYGAVKEDHSGRPASETDRPAPLDAAPWLMLAQTQLVVDASMDRVVSDLKRYALARDADGSPFGWRKHVVSQQHYVRYCCFVTLQELLRQGPAPLAGRFTAYENEGGGKAP